MLDRGDGCWGVPEQRIVHKIQGDQAPGRRRALEFPRDIASCGSVGMKDRIDDGEVLEVFIWMEVRVLHREVESGADGQDNKDPNMFLHRGPLIIIIIIIIMSRHGETKRRKTIITKD